MRPAIDPRLPLLWRDRSTVQVGLHPSRSVVLTGLDPATTAVLDRLDGTRELAELRAEATARGGSAADVARLLDMLDASGALADTVAEGVGNGWVEVCGAGLVGSALACLLIAEGVGWVTVDDPLPVTAQDVGPAGVRQVDVGRSREVAARAAMRAVTIHSERVRAPRRTPAAPSLVVLAPAEGMGRREALRLVGRGQAHLVVLTVGGLGLVGPLVVPGRTSCLRCHDLHRTDRDAQWPLLLGQLETVATRGVAPALLGTLTAAVATREVLDFLSSGRARAQDGTLEVGDPLESTRRRGWRQHPRCGCSWDGP